MEGVRKQQPTINKEHKHVEKVHNAPVPCSSVLFLLSFVWSPEASCLFFLLRFFLGLETGDPSSLPRSSFSFSPSSSKSGSSLSSSSLTSADFLAAFLPREAVEMDYLRQTGRKQLVNLNHRIMSEL